MGALAVRLRAELRKGWLSGLALAVLIGVLGGAVLAAAAGARRTDSAFSRMLASTGGTDFLVAPFSAGTAGPFYDDVERLPGVTSTGRVAGVELARLGPSGETELLDARVSLDGRFGTVVNAPKLLAGRLPDPARADEALANRQMADVLEARVGGRFTALATPILGDLSGATPVTFTVVGIGVFSQEVVPGSLLDASPQLLLTPAYGRERIGDERGYDGIAVRLHPDADREAFRERVEDLAVHHRDVVGDEIFIGDESEFHARTERAIRPQALALAAFAVLAGAAALLVVGQTFSRQLFREAVDYPVLSALGMSRGQLVILALARATLVGAVGATVAVAVAVAASPRMPIGPARVAEPDPGVAMDMAVLAPGALAVVLLLTGWAAVPAWRAASAGARVATGIEAARRRRPSRLASAAARAGLPPTITAGARMALEPGGGASTVPVRSTLAGVAVALAAVTAALTFAANLHRLVTTPSLYGRDWDVFLDAGFGAVALEDAARVLLSEPAVASFAGGNYGQVVIEGRNVPAVGIDVLHGHAFPTLLEGRPPAAAGEIVLGTKSLRAVGRSVGDTVDVEGSEGGSPMRVVGRAVLPKLGRGSFPPTGLGEGAVVPADVLPVFEAPPGVAAYGFYMVSFREDAGGDTRSRVVERLEREVCGSVRDVGCFVNPDQRPSDIGNYAGVQRTPLVLAGLLILLAVATLGHALATSVRRRRRDLAVLRAVGFVRRQVSSTVAWQATTVASVAGIIGVPLGVAAGRWAWAVFADQLGVAPDVVVPLLPVLIAIPAAVAVAVVVAALPGRLAGRALPAAALRAE